MCGTEPDRKTGWESGIFMENKVPFLVGTMLLVAAALKIWHFLRLTTASAVLHEPQGATPGLIAWETFLGLWPLFGVYMNAALRVAILCFSVFACDAFYEAVGGKADCGCFGQVRVNPWLTTAFDLLVICSLFFGAGPAGPSAAVRRRPSSGTLFAVFVVVGLAVGTSSYFLHPIFKATREGLRVADGGRLVILEPGKWIGLRFPLFGDLKISPKLRKGKWVLLFYHANCTECQQTIPIYERLAQDELLSGNSIHIAFIRVPSEPRTPVPANLFRPTPALRTTLDSQHQWIATTPIAVELRNGLVIATVSGPTAMNTLWIR